MAGTEIEQGRTGTAARLLGAAVAALVSAAPGVAFAGCQAYVGAEGFDYEVRDNGDSTSVLLTTCPGAAGNPSALVPAGETITSTVFFQPAVGTPVTLNEIPWRLTNRGTIVGDTDGIFLRSLLPGVQVINEGSVKASHPSGTAVSLYSGGFLINRAGAQIEGETGVAFQTRYGTVHNEGTITGSTGIWLANGGSVTNSGTITGGTAAINFWGDDNRLELWAGSAIIGNVVFTGGGTNNTLALGGAADSSFDVSQIGAAAQYQGFDRFEKTGSSTWTLSGTSTEAAPWTVNGGTLIVNGSIASSSLTTVNAGGVLGGNGTVGNTFIDGGVLAPGNSIGALTVAGNLVLTAASTYLVEVDPTAADFTHVTGTATLGGATVAAHFAPGSYVEKRYTILTADGGVNGTFSGPANTNLPQNFKSALAYDGTNAFLDLTLDYTPPGPPDFGNGLDTNQRNVATTLANYFDTHGGIPLAFGALDPRGLSQAAGEVATGASQAAFDAQSQFLNAMTDPFAAEQGAASSATPAMSYAGAPRDAYAALFAKAAPPAAHFERRWRVFGAAYGGAARISGDTTFGSHDATARVYGAMGGAAYALSPATQLGFALGGGGTSFGLSDGLGSGRSDLFQAGVFARHNFAHSGYLTGVFAYGWHDVTTDRIAPTGERLRGAYRAHVLSGRVETGWRIDTVYAGVTPYAAAQAISYRLPSYLEAGNGAVDSFALGYAGRDLAATRSELGLRLDRSTTWGDALVTLRGRAAWAHNFDRDRSLSATFQALPGTGFLVNGAAQADDAALVSAGAEIGWTNGLSLAAAFEGEFSATTTSYNGKGVVRYAW